MRYGIGDSVLEQLLAKMSLTYRKISTAAVLLLTRCHNNALSVSCSSMRRCISSSKAVRQNLLYTAVCVERSPVITAPKKQLEQDWTELMHQIEMENSLFCDHELHLKKDKLAQQKLKPDEEDLSATEAQTALDKEDAWDIEFKEFTTVSRTTKADEMNDTKSTERCLDQSLYLLVKQKIEGNDHWVFPQAAWKEGETMRQTAEKALTSVCGKVEASVQGNAPCAVAKFAHPHPEKANGVKVFFYKSVYKSGDITPNKEVASDYLWVTRNEMSKYCHHSYYKHMKKCIL